MDILKEHIIWKDSLQLFCQIDSAQLKNTVGFAA